MSDDRQSLRRQNCIYTRADKQEHAAHDWDDVINGVVHCTGYTARLGLPSDVAGPSVRFYEVRTVHGEAYWASADRVEQDVAWLTLWADDAIELRIPTPDVRTLRQVDPDEMGAADEGRDYAALTRVRGLSEAPGVILGNRGEPVGDSATYLLGYKMAIRDAKRAADFATAEGSEPEVVCCVCGRGDGWAVYRNYKEQAFCWPCADCGCNQDVCVRTGINAKAESAAPDPGGTS